MKEAKARLDHYFAVQELRISLVPAIKDDCPTVFAS